MGDSFGSFSWAQISGGRMTTAERLAETIRGMAALAADRSARLGRRLGLRPRAVELALAEIPIPRSTLAEAARQALEGTPPWLVGHCMRTYLWGALLGIRDGLAVDAEVFFVAALLHDLGLVHRDGAACFAFRGAEQARQVVLAAGAEPSAADRVADAIVMHLNVRVSAPAEARLVRAGAGLDVVGDRIAEIAPATRAEVIAAWPRDGFAGSVAPLLGDEARLHPETRAGFLCHRLGFLRLVERGERRFRPRS